MRGILKRRYEPIADCKIGNYFYYTIKIGNRIERRTVLNRRLPGFDHVQVITPKKTLRLYIRGKIYFAGDDLPEDHP